MTRESHLRRNNIRAYDEENIGKDIELCRFAGIPARKLTFTR